MQVLVSHARNLDAPRTFDAKRQILQRLPMHLIASYRLFRTGDWRSAASFLFANDLKISHSVRLDIIRRFHKVSCHIPCEHLQAEILAFVHALIKLPTRLQGCVVECGCYRGGSTAKLSIAAKLTDRQLFAFDTFEGIPENSEMHEKNIWGGPVHFSQGDYRGSLDEVRANVRTYGEIDACKFVKGLFQDTLPSFDCPVAAAFLDVDLVSSTAECMRHLWPLIVPGGVVFSHDGHLPLVLEVLANARLWREQFGSEMPTIHGLGKQKLIWMQKPALTHGL